MIQKLRLGMIGGGVGSFIGAIHRNAANLDGYFDLVCGAFSSTSERSRESGQALGIRPERAYGSYREMIDGEWKLPEHERMEVAAIVTPNHVHFEPAKLALEAGFHVVLDKPMTFDLAQAKILHALVGRTGRRLALTHTYTGYPMVKEAKALIASGALGRVRKVYVEYPQGWLSTALEAEGQKQAGWRTDPNRSGIAGCMGDIGTHAFNLAEYVSGLNVTHLCPDIQIFVPGRALDDDGSMLLRFEEGASGVLFATQVAAGAENNVKIRVYGELGGVEWEQENANSLTVKWLDRPVEVRRAGTGYLSDLAKANCRTPAGHPEGYLEAFANIYRNFARCILADRAGAAPDAASLDYPGTAEGVRGMAFIETVIGAGKSTQKWTEFKV